MRVNALDHVNICTDDLPGTAQFYADLLNLDVRDGPPPTSPDQVRWAYDEQDRPILHLNARGMTQSFPRDCPAGPTGPIHHVALNCSGKAEVLSRLEAKGARFSVSEIAAISLTQIFTHDPNGVLLELNFFGD